MPTNFYLNGQPVTSDAMEGQQVDADDVLNTGAFNTQGRDVVMHSPDGKSRLVNPGGKFTAHSGSQFQDVPKGTRGRIGRAWL